MKTIISILFAMGLVVSSASAQEIATVKGNRAIVNSVAPGTEVGDRFLVRDSNGKAKALVEIKQVKNGKAVVQILKGKPSQGQLLTPFKGASGKSGTASTISTRGAGGRSKSSGSTWGALLGYSMDTMSAKPGTGTSISMTGSSLDLSGFYNRIIDGSFGARVLAGYETLDVTGSEGGTTYSAKIGYLGLQGLLTYSYVNTTSANAWVGAGLGFLYALQKESNVIDTAKLTTNQTILVSLGLDYRASSSFFIPMQFDYAMFPDTNTSKATQMNFRVGIGYDF